MRLLVLFLLVPAIACGAEIIYSEDFEGPNGNEYYTTNDGMDSSYGTYWQSYSAVVDTLAHGGSKAFRSNWNPLATDPITGKVGHRSYDGYVCWDFGGMTTNTDDAVYMSYWARVDSFVFSSIDSDRGFEGKTAYITIDDVGNPSSGFYFGVHNWEDDSGADNGYLESNAEYSDWVPLEGNWETHTVSYLNPSVYNDGVWHNFEIYFNYTDDYMMMWVDGEIWEVDPGDSTPGNMTDGKLPIPSDMHIRGLYMFHTQMSIYVEDGPGGGIAGGWMLDDIVVYDGYPSGDGEPVTAVTNFTSVKDGN